MGHWPCSGHRPGRHWRPARCFGASGRVDCIRHVQCRPTYFGAIEADRRSYRPEDGRSPPRRGENQEALGPSNCRPKAISPTSAVAPGGSRTFIARTPGFRTGCGRRARKAVAGRGVGAPVRALGRTIAAIPLQRCGKGEQDGARRRTRSGRGHIPTAQSDGSSGRRGAKRHGRGAEIRSPGPRS